MPIPGAPTVFLYVWEGCSAARHPSFAPLRTGSQRGTVFASETLRSLQEKDFRTVIHEKNHRAPIKRLRPAILTMFYQIGKDAGRWPSSLEFPDRDDANNTPGAIYMIDAPQKFMEHVNTTAAVPNNPDTFP